jgi:hypothetical protein
MEQIMSETARGFGDQIANGEDLDGRALKARSLATTGTLHLA